MILTELTPPPTEPVTQAELSAHLRLNYGFSDTLAEDGLLDLYLRNARAAIELRIEQALIRRRFRVETGRWDRNGRFALPIGPVAQLDSFAITRNGARIDADPQDFSISPGSNRQMLSGLGGGALPAIQGGSIAEIEFEAGHGLTSDEIPGSLRQAVLILAAHLYEHRTTRGSEMIPTGVRALIEPHRSVRL